MFFLIPIGIYHCCMWWDVKYLIQLHLLKKLFCGPVTCFKVKEMTEVKIIKYVNFVPSGPLKPNLVCHLIVKRYDGNIYIINF